MENNMPSVDGSLVEISSDNEPSTNSLEEQNVKLKNSPEMKANDTRGRARNRSNKKK